MKVCQLAAPFWFWVILISCSFRHTYGTWQPKAHVVVTNAFQDQRHITTVCQSFVKGVAEKFLVRDLLAYPNNLKVQYVVEKFGVDTVNRCMMVWRREANGEEAVQSVFEVFSGCWDYDLISVWDPEDKIIRYKWKLAESGLSLYSYSLRDYRLVKPLRSIQVIDVYVNNGIQNRFAPDIHISCLSNQPHRHGSFLAHKTRKGGEFVTWSVGDFDLETVQECKVKFDDKHVVLSFEAFRGNWHHDDFIWDEEKQERKYVWTVKDDGLYVRNFETKLDEIIVASPNNS